MTETETCLVFVLLVSVMFLGPRRRTHWFRCASNLINTRLETNEEQAKRRSTGGQGQTQRRPGDVPGCSPGLRTAANKQRSLPPQDTATSKGKHMGQFTGLDRVHTESKIHSTTEQTVQSGAGVRVLVPQVDSLTIQQRCAAPAGLWVAYAH